MDFLEGTLFLQECKKKGLQGLPAHIDRIPRGVLG